MSDSSALASGYSSMYTKMSNMVSTSTTAAHMTTYINPSSSDDQLHMLLLSLPFLFYTLLWFAPTLWVSLCGKGNHPSELMGNVAHVLKVVQFYVMYSLCKNHYLSPSQWIDELGQTTVICSVFLFVLGQYLNVSVYTALGTNGVYYGVRFGIDVPWCYDFPFNVSWLKHPQYIGTCQFVSCSMHDRCLCLCGTLLATTDFFFFFLLDTQVP